MLIVTSRRTIRPTAIRVNFNSGGPDCFSGRATKSPRRKRPEGAFRGIDRDFVWFWSVPTAARSKTGGLYKTQPERGGRGFVKAVPYRAFWEGTGILVVKLRHDRRSGI